MSTTKGAGPGAGGPQKGPGERQAFLPQWVQSAISRITGRECFCTVNMNMQCLDNLHSALSSLVRDVRRGDMAHLTPALFCPSLACKGICKVHENNGTFVALARGGEVLYARCADWTCCCEQKDLEAGWMEVVAGGKAGTRPWIKLTAEKMAEFEKRTQHEEPKWKKKKTTSLPSSMDH